jgi:hypothetical protein
MKARKLWVVGAAGLVAACSPVLVNVPVAGPPAALRQLEGEWVGQYSGAAGGREGGLLFRLEAGEKTATGEVWMNLRSQEPLNYPGSAPAIIHETDPLVIRFVWIEDDFVSGTLELYRDPVTDNILMTTFRGRVDDDEIKGTFVTENKTTGAISSGTWSAKRVVRVSDDQW